MQKDDQDGQDRKRDQLINLKTEKLALKIYYQTFKGDIDRVHGMLLNELVTKLDYDEKYKWDLKLINDFNGCLETMIQKIYNNSINMSSIIGNVDNNSECEKKLNEIEYFIKREKSQILSFAYYDKCQQSSLLQLFNTISIFNNLD